MLGFVEKADPAVLPGWQALHGDGHRDRIICRSGERGKRAFPMPPS